MSHDSRCGSLPLESVHPVRPTKVIHIGPAPTVDAVTPAAEFAVNPCTDAYAQTKCASPPYMLDLLTLLG
jgi:hypothetical protein